MRFLELLALLSALSQPPDPVLAGMLQGEVLASGCPVEAALVAARVWDTRGGTTDGWFGWQEPSDTALLVARVYQLTEDLSGGAQFFMSDEDKLRVGFLDDAVLTGEWRCEDGTTMQAWLEKGTE